MQNSDFWTRITSFYGSLTSPVVFCIQNSVISIRFYGSQPSSVVFACKTETFGPELLVSIGPSPHLSSCGFKTAWFAPEWQVYLGSAIICGFYIQNSDFSTRMTSVYGFHPSHVVLYIHNRDFRIRLTSLYWSQTSSVVLSTHNGVLSSRISSLYVFQPSRVVLCMQNIDFRTGVTSLCGSQTSLEVFACKTVTLGPDQQGCIGPRPNI